MSDRATLGAQGLTFAQLEYLVEVGRGQSFRSAATHLHMSVSNVSRQIANLERLLGVVLFERRPDGVRLTAAGHDVYKEATRILQAVNRIAERGRDADRSIQGVVSIACYPVHVERLLGRVIGTFRRKFPQVRIDLSQMRDDRRRTWGERLFDEVRKGDVDLAMGPPHATGGLRGMRVYDARIVAMVPDDDPYRFAKSMPIHAFEKRPVLIAPNEFFSRERVSTEARVAGFELDVAAQSSSPTALLVLGRNGVGTPVLPDDYPLVGQQRFPYPVIEDANGMPISTPVWLHWRSEELEPAVARFVSEARAEVRRESRLGRVFESYYGADLISNHKQEEQRTMEIKQLQTVQDVADYAADDAVQTLRAAIQERGHAYWVLAGGTSPMAAYRAISSRHADAVDWSKVTVVVGDERCVPIDHKDSNWGEIAKALLRDNGTGAIRALVPEAHLGAEAGAEDYAEQITSALGPQASRHPDLVWLGVGEDGHTLSLFPGRTEISERDELVLPIHDSPKPPADRITLTLGAVAGARRVVIFAVGAAKRDALAQALSDAHSLPIGQVSQAVEEEGGQVLWVFDEAARSDPTP